MSNLNPEQFGPFHRYDDSIEAAHHNVKWDQYHGVDAWGEKLKQPYDGHGAWGCNNYDCAEHPQSMYDNHMGVQGMPGWLQHDTDPHRDVKREVNKTFYEAGMHEDGPWLLDQGEGR